MKRHLGSDRDDEVVDRRPSPTMKAVRREIPRVLGSVGGLILLAACAGCASDEGGSTAGAVNQPAAAPARPDAAVEQGVRDYLEGAWVSGEDPGGKACIADWVGGWKTEIEFEFRKTGGRVLVFEPPDLFTAVELEGIDADGDVLKLSAKARDGASVPYGAIRKIDHERFEFRGAAKGAAGDRPEILHRCGGPDLSVNPGVSPEQLSWLTPAWSGSYALIEARPGVDDRDLCSGTAPEDPSRNERALQFEVLGPVHYWVLGLGRGTPRVEFDYIRRITRIDDRSVKLVIQQHSDSPRGWDPPGAAGRIYEWTVISDGERVRIPEIGASFARCRRDEPAGLGLHRWG